MRDTVYPLATRPIITGYAKRPPADIWAKCVRKFLWCVCVCVYVCTLFTLYVEIGVLNASQFFIILLIFMRYRRVISHTGAGKKRQSKGKREERSQKPKTKRKLFN